MGSLVLCRVLRLKEDRAIVKILKIDGKTSQSAMEGVIRRQNVRQYEVDKLKMDECFIPGDIVLAQLMSYGDSRTLFLSTASDHLGVVFAKSQESGTYQCVHDRWVDATHLVGRDDLHQDGSEGEENCSQAWF